MGYCLYRKGSERYIYCKYGKPGGLLIRSNIIRDDEYVGERDCLPDQTELLVIELLSTYKKVHSFSSLLLFVIRVQVLIQMLALFSSRFCVSDKKKC